MTELKPCPFCGSENIHSNTTIWGYWHIWCHDCPAEIQSNSITTEAEAITAWNRRGEE